MPTDNPFDPTPTDSAELEEKRVACFRAALNAESPEESRRWVDLADWLLLRVSGPPTLTGGHPDDRRQYPRVPVNSSALFSIGDRVLTGATRDLSRSGACLILDAAPDGLAPADRGRLTVQGWVQDRTAAIVSVEDRILRLVYL